ncbi:UNVERIFIED_CONTAM: hypothetical protein GTU68_023129 [Idotea baltica]|nr:hypothetical protein [Idotea baltica]
MTEYEENIEVRGARVHNLKNIDVTIPRDKLVVITGLSGSGKSSLAFDTIYAEGQRRYIETFSAYARQFLGGLERPDVDKIDGLSPVIAIEQKTTSKSPRSTVGTITEIYDFLRLLFARAGDAHSYNTGEKMVSYSDEQIKKLIIKDFAGKKINILSPIIKSRKGHYRELFEQIGKQGFVKVRVDGTIKDIVKGMKVDRYKTHDIEIVIDRLKVTDNDDLDKRLSETINTAMYSGENVLMVLEEGTEEPRYFSRDLMCPTTGISYPSPEPNTFSFNSPKGMCPYCNGLGHVHEVNVDKIFPDKKLTIKSGGIAPLGDYKDSWAFRQIETIGQRYGFTLTDPISTISDEAIQILLYGGQESFEIDSKTLGVKRTYKIDYEGISNFIKSQYEESGSTSLKRWAKDFMNKEVCSECNGARLKKASLYFKIANKNIADLAHLDVAELASFFDDLATNISDVLEMTINEAVDFFENIPKIHRKLKTIKDVGLGYISLGQQSTTLSGGEAQRVKLATELSKRDTGNTFYILDEPTTGLHFEDIRVLMEVLNRLTDKGNTVLVIEHNMDVIKMVDYIIDIGYEGGRGGGMIVAKGSPEQVAKDKKSYTAKFLKEELFPKRTIK